ncbi:MAG: cache domain-containing protein [Burkholderiales bacterium]|nr:cache domain-containing protein [Burkholderiales bacterium]
MARVRGKLFRKYLVVLVLLVGGLLTAASAIEVYFSYQESQRVLVKVEREKAVAAAETIERFIQEIEHHVRSTTRAIADDPSVAAPRRRAATYRETLASALAEQRELDFLRLLRNVPAIAELRYIDVAGKEQIRVSRLALDAIGSGADFADSPAYKGARAGKVYFSPVYFRHESEPFVTVAIPADPSAFEVITAEVSLRAMWDVVSRIKVGSVGFAYVVDAQGRLIAHPDLRQVLKGRDMSALPQVRAALADRAGTDAATAVTAATGLDGGEVLTAHAPIATPGWGGVHRAAARGGVRAAPGDDPARGADPRAGSRRRNPRQRGARARDGGADPEAARGCGAHRRRRPRAPHRGAHRRRA